MSGVLNSRAQEAYQRLLAHCFSCRPCGPRGDNRMCDTGRRLLDLWEHAEANAVVVA